MPAENPFLQITAEFNAGRLRAIICSGRAVVLHRLAMMSKDGGFATGGGACHDVQAAVALLPRVP